jgi:hypothetical protein
MVWVLEGGVFIMNAGSAITGNIKYGSERDAGAVYVDNKATITMYGGSISGNTAGNRGGGVCVAGTFTMYGGAISGNTASRGGGVAVRGSRTFTMINGVISGNTASIGGGVYKEEYADFTMRGGTITANTARQYGGGVYAPAGWSDKPTVSKTNGTITGYTSDSVNGNVVRDADDNVLARRGHAVFTSENARKETTAGPGPVVWDK